MVLIYIYIYIYGSAILHPRCRIHSTPSQPSIQIHRLNSHPPTCSGPNLVSSHPPSPRGTREREPFRASFCGTRCGLRGTAWCAALGVSKRSGGAASRGAATARPRGERRGLRDARGTGRAKVAARGERRRPARVAAGRVTHGMGGARRAAAGTSTDGEQRTWAIAPGGEAKKGFPIITEAEIDSC